MPPGLENAAVLSVLSVPSSGLDPIPNLSKEFKESMQSSIHLEDLFECMEKILKEKHLPPALRESPWLLSKETQANAQCMSSLYLCIVSVIVTVVIVTVTPETESEERLSLCVWLRKPLCREPTLNVRCLGCSSGTIPS